ncbi:MAG: DUF624 domain-containing protein [Pseudobutyrivibrio sp.]|nr:DUF624 domain-containing protein [Pseudobutyrivibrio sp.]
MNIGRIFSPDNIVARVLSCICDGVWLTILWFVCSIPVVTIGASTKAVYAVTLKMVKGQEGIITKQFFEAFKESFWQSTAAWAIIVISGLVCSINIYFFYNQDSEFAKMMMLVQLVAAFIILSMFTYIFPAIAKFSNSLKNLFIISFVLAVRNLGWTLLMNTITVCFIVAGVYIMAPLLIISAGGIALLNSIMLAKIFDKYIVENDMQQV